MLHTPEASPTGSPEPDALRVTISRAMSDQHPASPAALDGPPHHQLQTSTPPAPPAPPPPQAHPSASTSSTTATSTSSDSKASLEDVNASALPTPEMSPMDQEKDCYQLANSKAKTDEGSRNANRSYSPAGYPSRSTPTPQYRQPYVNPMGYGTQQPQQPQQPSAISAMGVANGMMMMCTNQRLLGKSFAYSLRYRLRADDPQI